MLNRKDVASLEQAGIRSVDALIAAAADFVRRHPLRDPALEPNPLSVEEEEFLRSTGARGLDKDDEAPAARRANLTVVTAEFAQMVASADTVQQVAERLGVKSSRIRQRIGERSLYVIEGPAGRVFPRFQFTATGVLPGLATVLAAIDPQMHPVAVERFFLSVSPDLESELVDEPMSPRDWLLAGHPAEPIAVLASEP